jgi:hypothetical protein
MPRKRLPDRRQAETLDLWHGDRRFHVTVGQYDDGRPGEVFLHGARVGSDVDGLCGDVGVLISRLLQHGDDPASLAAGIGRLGNGEPASIIGAIADVLASKAAGPSSPGGAAP